VRDRSPLASAAPVVVWLRQDLRLDHNPVVAAATALDRPLVFVFILDDETPAQWRLGGASRWWLHHSLTALEQDIRAREGVLVFRRGDSAAILSALVEEIGASHVLWSRMIEPFAIRRDTTIKAALTKAGIIAESVNAQLLAEPWTLKPASGPFFKVFTPFWKAASAKGFASPCGPAPKHLACGGLAPKSDKLADWALTPSKPDWAVGLRETWVPGEAGARARLDQFLRGTIEDYKDGRNRPDKESTSRLSPHLHFGEISPHICVQAALACDAPRSAVEKFLAELGWREFSHHLLYHAPDLPLQNWRADFNAFPWRSDDDALRAWQRGETGYPIVDAGMRELWRTGWMHNRVRMITASFLIKHLLIDWRAGQDWFWDTLVDADLANNAASWQWVAGSGADAAPYFRIFNPIAQGKTYDPDGAYVRRFVPELASLPTAYIHAPWEAPALVLQHAGVTLGKTYPRPIVDHAEARQRALKAFESIKRTHASASD
jgi:deoxyribodipyrimidine photo-lyase